MARSYIIIFKANYIYFLERILFAYMHHFPTSLLLAVRLCTKIIAYSSIAYMHLTLLPPPILTQYWITNV